MLDPSLLNTPLCAEALPILRSLPDQSVDLVLTDPPYNLGEAEKHLLQAEFCRVSRGAVIVFAPPENQWLLPADQYLFWVKPISTKNTSQRYSRFVEMLFVYGRGAWECRRHWSQYTNVFTDLVDDVSLHPFRKPPSMIRRLILNHTLPNQIVLDCFAGSLVVPQVCLETGRNFVAIERERSYIQGWSYNSGGQQNN